MFIVIILFWKYFIIAIYSNFIFYKTFWAYYGVSSFLRINFIYKCHKFFGLISWLRASIALTLQITSTNNKRQSFDYSIWWLSIVISELLRWFWARRARQILLVKFTHTLWTNRMLAEFKEMRLFLFIKLITARTAI